MAVALFSASANAQPVPPPGFHELELAIIIARAGYDCPSVASIEVMTNPMPGWESLRPEVAVCQDGKRYLIAHSGRRGADARPVVRPLPAPAKE
jgi:hypothetical protein